MINSCGTGKPTEADGSGRRRSGSSPAKVRCASSPAAAAGSTAAAPRKAHWRAQRSPTPKKLLFCCAAVLSFCGPGLRPCRLWHSSSRIHRSSTPEGALASGAKPHRSRSQQQQDPAAFFFLCCCGRGSRTDAGGKADGEENGSGSSGSGGFGMPGG